MGRIPAIDLEIDGLCNLRCTCCWGTPHDMKQQYPLSRWLDLLRTMQDEAELAAVTLTGGEPLLVDGIEGFVEDAAGLGLNMYLETNGFFLLDHLSRMAPHLRNISVPLEGPDPEKSGFRRGYHAFGKAVECLEALRAYPEISVKVGTTVFRQNLGCTPEIGEVLLCHGFKERFPDKAVWKIYQGTKFGAGRRDPEWPSMMVSDGEFRKMASGAMARYAGSITSTAIASNETGGYCIIVRPNGEVVSNGYDAGGEEFSVFPNIFDDVSGGMRAIIGYQSVCRGKNRLVSSYFFDWDNHYGDSPTSPASS